MRKQETWECECGHPTEAMHVRAEYEALSKEYTEFRLDRRDQGQRMLRAINQAEGVARHLRSLNPTPLIEAIEQIREEWRKPTRAPRKARQRRSGPVPSTPAPVKESWWVVSEATLRSVLDRAKAGADPEILFAELKAEAEVERSGMSEAAPEVHAGPEMEYMVGRKGQGPLPGSDAYPSMQAAFDDWGLTSGELMFCRTKAGPWVPVGEGEQS